MRIEICMILPVAVLSVCGCVCSRDVEVRLSALEKECGLVDEPPKLKPIFQPCAHQPLAELESVIPFTEAVELAKKNDAKGYFKLAVSYYYGSDVRSNEKIARYFFEKSAKAGDLNAEFALTLLTEKDHASFYGVRIFRNGQDNVSSNGSRLLGRNGVDRERYGSLPQSNLLRPKILPLLSRRQSLQNLIVPTLPPLTNSSEIVALRAKYHSFVCRGIACATNDVARCDDWLWGYNEWCKRRSAMVANKAVKEAEKKAKDDLQAQNNKLVEELLPKDLWVSSTNMTASGVNRSLRNRPSSIEERKKHERDGNELHRLTEELKSARESRQRNRAR